MDKEIFELFNSISCFKLYETKSSILGYTKIYKYYPNYLGDKHFTMLLFIMKNSTMSVDYKLYIHNSDNTLFYTVFCANDDYTWGNKNIPILLNDIFKYELRLSKIKKIKNNIYVGKTKKN